MRGGGLRAFWVGFAFGLAGTEEELFPERDMLRERGVALVCEVRRGTVEELEEREDNCGNELSALFTYWRLHIPVHKS
jgi:hypothetical protein